MCLTRDCMSKMMRLICTYRCVDDTRNVTQDRQQNVDEEIGIATSLEEDT